MEAVIFILGFCAIISFIAFRSTFFGLKLLAGMSWIAFIVYWVSNPLPTEFPQGEGAHTAILVIAIGFGLMIVLSGLFRGIQRTERWENGEETSSHLSLPNWMKNMTVNDVERKKRNTAKEVAEYEDKMDRALGLGKYSRRR
jgi:vacuolar-type H+-ATPase subunit I/STV1